MLSFVLFLQTKFDYFIHLDLNIDQIRCSREQRENTLNPTNPLQNKKSYAGLCMKYMYNINTKSHALTRSSLWCIKWSLIYVMPTNSQEVTCSAFEISWFELAQVLYTCLTISTCIITKFKRDYQLSKFILNFQNQCLF